MTRNFGAPTNEKADPNAKDKFKNLDDQYKAEVAADSTEQIYKRISMLAGEMEALAIAKENDVDLANKKAEYDTCNDPYKQQTKELKLRTKFALRVLSDRGAQ